MLIVGQNPEVLTKDAVFNRVTVASVTLAGSITNSDGHFQAVGYAIAMGHTPDQLNQNCSEERASTLLESLASWDLV